MTLHQMGRLIGEHKMRLRSTNGYTVFITFITTSLTVVKIYGLSGWWAALILPIYVFLYWIDNRAVLSGEFHYQNQKNEEWQEALGILKELRSKDEQSIQ